MPREILAVEVQVMQFQRQTTGNWTPGHSHSILENGLISLAGEISHRLASRLWQALIHFYSQRTKGCRHVLIFVMEKKFRVVEKAST